MDKKSTGNKKMGIAAAKVSSNKSSNKSEYIKAFGNIRIRKSLDGHKRKPVIPPSYHDPNRTLMIKFKYGTLKDKEAEIFHENVKKLIFRVMHSNPIMMDWDDVYQEIWKKILKSRHTWKEYKGTMVSTWITIVATSVISTLRTCVARHNSRFCLYDDIGVSSSSDENDNSSGAQEKCDAVNVAINGEDCMMDSDFEKAIIKDQFMEFMSSLTDPERTVMDRAISMQDQFLASYKNPKKKKYPIGDLKSNLGYDDSTFNEIMYGIKSKYCKMYNRDMKTLMTEDEQIDPDKDVDGFGNFFLF